MILEKMINECGMRVINIGLENAAVAAARVVEGPSRSSLKRVEKRRCLQNVWENQFLPGIKGELGQQTGADP